MLLNFEINKPLFKENGKESPLGYLLFMTTRNFLAARGGAKEMSSKIFFMSYNI